MDMHPREWNLFTLQHSERNETFMEGWGEEEGGRWDMNLATQLVRSSPVFSLSPELSGVCPSSFTLTICFNGVYSLTENSQTLLKAIHHNWQLRLHSSEWWKVWVGFCCAKENTGKNLFCKVSALTTTFLCRKLADILPLLNVGLWFFPPNTRIIFLQLQGFQFSALQREHRVIPWNLQNCCRSMEEGRGSFISLFSVFPHSDSPWVGLDSSPRHFASFTHKGESMCVCWGLCSTQREPNTSFLVTSGFSC